MCIRDRSNTGDEVTEGNFANKSRTDCRQVEEGEDGDGQQRDGPAGSDGLDGLEEGGGGEGSEELGAGRCKPQSPPTNWAGRASTSTAAGEAAVDLKSRQREMSMTRSLARKKSVPKMGFLTSARMNTCTTRKPGKERKIFFFP